MLRLACAFLSLLALLASGPLSAADAPAIQLGAGAVDPASDGLASVLMALAAASIPGYVCLQLFLLYRYSGGWRVAAGLPLAGMIPLALYTLAALLMGSSLWPLMMLFLAPPAFLYLAGLTIVRFLARRLAPS